MSYNEQNNPQAMCVGWRLIPQNPSIP